MLEAKGLFALNFFFWLYKISSFYNSIAYISTLTFPAKNIFNYLKNTFLLPLSDKFYCSYIKYV